MLPPLDLLTLALAACYWAFVLAKKPGAFGIFTWMREHLPHGGLLLCPPCLVFWVGLAFWALWQTPLAPLVTVSAVAGGATFIGYYGGVWQQ